MVSDMSHTKEPWRIRCHTCETPADIGEADDYTIEGADGTAVAFEPRNLDPNRGADARRAVACVNACAGIPTELLEQGLGLGAIRNGEAIECDALEKQRNELLAALECIYSWAHNWDSEFMNDPEWRDKDHPWIQSVVAKVKGGA